MTRFAKTALAAAALSLAASEAALQESRCKADAALHRALHDPLTGLPNRGQLQERLDDAIAQISGADGKPFTIGIGLQSARLATIFPQPHDIPLNVILTEAGIQFQGERP
mgnify:CR=1 FL=1